MHGVDSITVRRAGRLAGALVLATMLGCGAEAESATSAPAVPAAPTPSPVPGAPVAPAPGPTPAQTAAGGGCPDATTLSIENGASSPLLAGVPATIAPATAFADATRQSATFAFTSFELEPPPAGRSRRAPMGAPPNAPAGGVTYVVRLDAPSDLAAGEYTTAGGAAGRVSFVSMYAGDQRVMPLRDVTVRLTHVTDDELCGEIVAAGDPNALQSFPGVAGRFRVPRE